MCGSSSWRDRGRDIACMLRTSSLLFRKRKRSFFVSFSPVKQSRQFDDTIISYHLERIRRRWVASKT